MFTTKLPPALEPTNTTLPCSVRFSLVVLIALFNMSSNDSTYHPYWQMRNRYSVLGKIVNCYLFAFAGFALTKAVEIEDVRYTRHILITPSNAAILFSGSLNTNPSLVG